MTEASTAATMADSSFFGRMFAFMGRPMPQQPPGPYQTTGTLLRVFGWIGFASLVLAILGLLFAMVAVTLLGAVFDAFFSRWFDSGLGAAFAALAILVFLFGLVVLLAVGGGLLFWVGYTYDLWRQRDARALGSLLGLAIASVVLGALSVLGWFGDVGSRPMDGGSMTMGFSTPVSGLVLLGFGITFLVMQSNPQVKAAFAPVVTAPGPPTSPARPPS